MTWTLIAFLWLPAGLIGVALTLLILDGKETLVRTDFDPMWSCALFGPITFLMTAAVFLGWSMPKLMRWALGGRR